MNLKRYIGSGLMPEQFISGMTRNQEQFQTWYDDFSWEEVGNHAYFQSFQGKSFQCLILAADWCGDVVRNMPVLFHVMEAAGIPAEVLIMESHLDVMDEFLTMGGRSIPVVLIVDNEGDVVGRWGPRPAYIQEPMVEFKLQNTDRNAADYEDRLKQTRQEIMRRYGTDTAYQKLIVDELRGLLESL
jgi:hypothetical protein